MKEGIGRTLVMGAGISGIRSALDLAQAGYQVTLVDHLDRTGGLLSQVDHQFPTSTCGFCRMLPMTERDKASQHCLRRGFFHDNIEVVLGCDLLSLEGGPGDFTARLAQKRHFVDTDHCTGCGVCEGVCPVEIPDVFNEGLTLRKAIGLACPQSFTNAYTIDLDACTLCGECETVCPTQAITLGGRDKEAFHILVVDDEPIVRDSLKEWLDLEGFGVQTAGSGQQALDLMENAQFHMMLTDIKMPGMDGVQLLDRAKAKTPDLTVIMMTAYAEVDSAVDAMKKGALDYVTKPFEPEKVIARVEALYKAYQSAMARVEPVDAVILAMGTGFYSPEANKNVYGYQVIPGVMTSMEFERTLYLMGSRTGPNQGKICHPVTDKPLRKIAWLQCVGSRDQTRGFCSSVCCMISIKQALLMREAYPDLEKTQIFYMDLRTPKKSHDLYRAKAAKAGVEFVRARVHSLAPCPGENSGAIQLRYADARGAILDTEVDLVVLANGQHLSSDMKAFITDTQLETNAWGFVQSQPFAMEKTSRPGIFIAGGLTGFKQISDSVTLASAAAMSAIETMIESGKLSERALAASQQGKDEQNQEPDTLAAMDREMPRVLVVLCQCTRFVSHLLDLESMAEHIGKIPEVTAIELTDGLCSDGEWESCLAMVSMARQKGANRLVVAGCPLCMKRESLAALAMAMGIPIYLAEGVDLFSPVGKWGQPGQQTRHLSAQVITQVNQAISRVKHMTPLVPEPWSFFDRALVVGGGLAGLTTALAIANSGFQVDLVEKETQLGGNLSWIQQTIDGEKTGPWLSSLVDKVASHENIVLYSGTCVVKTSGLPGQWTTTLEKEDGEKIQVSHGVTLLATGGNQAEPSEKLNPGMYTQKAFQLAMDQQEIDFKKLESVVMIQCWRGRRLESQGENNRNYCSRVCCLRSLHQALFLKETNPKIQVYILYRDMMTHGFSEQYYTKARQAGVICIPYDPGENPRVEPFDTGAYVFCRDPILDRDVQIHANALVLATGVEPNLSTDLAAMFLAKTDEFGFFREADPKWRPVDVLHPRIFGCGLCLGPCSLEEAVVTARAAAVRAVGILSGSFRPSHAIARVRTAYCSQCQLCVPACPFKARAVDPENGQIVVDALACQGCGICAVVCPSKAAQVEGISGQHMMDVIDLALAN